MQSPVRFWRRFREALVQSQVRFNRVPEKVPEKVGDSGEGSRKPWWSGSTGSGEGCREGPGEGFGNLWHRARSGATGSTGFPALSFAARFRKICKNEICGCWGYHRNLFQNVQFGKIIGHEPGCSAHLLLRRLFVDLKQHRFSSAAHAFCFSMMFVYLTDLFCVAFVVETCFRLSNFLVKT